MRNHLATLLLSTGVPMLTAGDELGRTQQGNNNAYCQDNEISWIDWKDVDEDLRAFVVPAGAAAALLAGAAPGGVLRGPRDPRAPGAPATSPGSPRTAASCPPPTGSTPGLQTLGMYLDGRGIRHRDEHGRPVVDDSYLVQLHAGPEPVTVQLPGPPWADGYELVVSTEYADRRAARADHRGARARSSSPSRCVWLLRVLRRP